VRRRLLLFWTKKIESHVSTAMRRGETADTKGGRVGGAHYRQKVVLFVQEIKTARQERGPFSLRRTFFLLMEIYFYGRPKSIERTNGFDSSANLRFRSVFHEQGANRLRPTSLDAIGCGRKETDQCKLVTVSTESSQLGRTERELDSWPTDFPKPFQLVPLKKLD
jgi:hypothetical protein